MGPRPPRSPLFPYTTLFRSCRVGGWRGSRLVLGFLGPYGRPVARPFPSAPPRTVLATFKAPGSPRSEEHTSELQSRRDPGCRLLLEKKNACARSPSAYRTGA